MPVSVSVYTGHSLQCTLDYIYWVDSSRTILSGSTVCATQVPLIVVKDKVATHFCTYDRPGMAQLLYSPCTGENDPMGSSMKKMTIWVRKLCLEVQNSSVLLFAPIRSVVQNPHCHFSMHEPIGSFSPVQGDTTLAIHSTRVHCSSEGLDSFLKGVHLLDGVLQFAFLLYQDIYSVVC